MRCSQRFWKTEVENMSAKRVIGDETVIFHQMFENIDVFHVIVVHWREVLINQSCHVSN